MKKKDSKEKGINLENNRRIKWSKQLYRLKYYYLKTFIIPPLSLIKMIFEDKEINKMVF